MSPTASQPDELINPADFRSIELRISFDNETTRTAVKDGQRIYGETKSGTKVSSDEEPLTVLLLEFSDNGLVLEVPALSCAQGHRLSMNIKIEGLQASTRFPKGAFELKLAVAVAESEKIDKRKDRISVELIDVDAWAWSQFTEIYSERQRQIVEFFEAVKP